MAGAIITVYKFSSVVRGHCVYKTVLIQLIDNTLQVVCEHTNEYDECAVAISKGGYFIWHIYM